MRLPDQPFGGTHGRAPETLPTWENYQPTPGAWQEVYVNAPSSRRTPRRQKLQQLEQARYPLVSEFEPPASGLDDQPDGFGALGDGGADLRVRGVENTGPSAHAPAYRTLLVLLSAKYTQAPNMPWPSQTGP